MTYCLSILLTVCQFHLLLVEITYVSFVNYCILPQRATVARYLIKYHLIILFWIDKKICRTKCREAFKYYPKLELQIILTFSHSLSEWKISFRQGTKQCSIRYFAKFTRKHLFRNLFLIRLQACRDSNTSAFL